MRKMPIVQTHSDNQYDTNNRSGFRSTVHWVKSAFVHLKTYCTRGKNVTEMVDYTLLDDATQKLSMSKVSDADTSKSPRPFQLSICPVNQPSFFSKDTVVFCEIGEFYDIESAGVYRVYTTRERKSEREKYVVSLWPLETPFQYVRVWPAKSTRLRKDPITDKPLIVFANNKGMKTQTPVVDNVCDIILSTKIRSRPSHVNQGDKKTFVPEKSIVN